jgi:hypothetical protein
MRLGSQRSIPRLSRDICEESWRTGAGQVRVDRLVVGLGRSRCAGDSLSCSRWPHRWGRALHRRRPSRRSRCRRGTARRATPTRICRGVTCAYAPASTARRTRTASITATTTTARPTGGCGPGRQRLGGRGGRRGLAHGEPPLRAHSRVGGLVTRPRSSDSELTLVRKAQPEPVGADLLGDQPALPYKARQFGVRVDQLDYLVHVGRSRGHG